MLEIINYNTAPILQLRNATYPFAVTNISNVATLRTTEPSYDGQVIQLLGVTTAGTGSSRYFSDYGDTTSTDDGKTIIVTTAGKRWKIVDEDLDEDDFSLGIPTTITVSVDIGNRRAKNLYARLLSTSSTPNACQITSITSGQRKGQTLNIHSRFDGTKDILFNKDSANVELSYNIIIKPGDTISFYWDGSVWKSKMKIEVGDSYANLQMHGGVGDSSFDNSSAFASAYSQANKVYIPRGVFKAINVTVPSKSCTFSDASGKEYNDSSLSDTIIRSFDTGSLSSNDTIFDVSNSVGAKFQGFVVDGDTNNNNTGRVVHGIYAKTGDCNQMTIRDVTVARCLEGLGSNYANQFYIRSLKAENFGSTKNITGVMGLIDCKFNMLTISSIVEVGILLKSGQSSNVFDNYRVEQCQTFGIDIEDASVNSFGLGIIDDCQRSGFITRGNSINNTINTQFRRNARNDTFTSGDRSHITIGGNADGLLISGINTRATTGDGGVAPTTPRHIIEWLGSHTTTRANISGNNFAGFTSSAIIGTPPIASASYVYANNTI